MQTLNTVVFMSEADAPYFEIYIRNINMLHLNVCFLILWAQLLIACLWYIDMAIAGQIFMSVKGKVVPVLN
jgi:hypothetical protein